MAGTESPTLPTPPSPQPPPSQPPNPPATHPAPCRGFTPMISASPPLERLPDLGAQPLPPSAPASAGSCLFCRSEWPVRPRLCRNCLGLVQVRAGPRRAVGQAGRRATSVPGPARALGSATQAWGVSVHCVPLSGTAWPLWHTRCRAHSHVAPKRPPRTPWLCRTGGLAWTPLVRAPRKLGA